MKKLPVSHLSIFEIMSEPPLTVTLKSTVREVIKLFLDKKISGAPIVENNSTKVISVVSEADLMKFAAMDGLDQPLLFFIDKLADQKNLVIVGPEEPFAEVFKKFLLKPVRRVLVVDASGYLLGIISRRDIIRAFIES